MKIPKCKPVTSESAMNCGCLTSLALHPGPSGLPPLFCPVLCTSSSFFWLLCPPTSTPSTCSMPGPGGWNPSTHLSYTHQPQPCCPTLPNLTSSRPPLGVPPRARLGGDSWHRPQILMHIHPLFSGQVLLPLCQGRFHSGY